MAPQFVTPYVKSNKNDANDAEAICEAVARPTMRFVAIKSIAQQDIQAVHRIRSELVHQRTAKVNQIRGLLAEYGTVVSRRIDVLEHALLLILEDAGKGLTADFRVLLEGLQQDLATLNGRVDDLDKTIKSLATSHTDAKRLQQIPGIGPIIATALICAIGDGKQFKRGRDMAARLGLTPRQHQENLINIRFLFKRKLPASTCFPIAVFRQSFCFAKFFNPHRYGISRAAKKSSNIADAAIEKL
ncbi:MAG: IS110 family transposase [Methylococcales bacterium]|nr:IS110 family transposase [Methylococcales bacterium]